jgi:hypothetical protein
VVVLLSTREVVCVKGYDSVFGDQLLGGNFAVSGSTYLWADNKPAIIIPKVLAEIEAAHAVFVNDDPA